MTDAHQSFPDEVEGRKGNWMQTSRGGKFFPLDPRVEEVTISDIANGLALDCRYAGQGAIDKFYSVAEHSYHMAAYAFRTLNWPPEALLAVLLHDAAEAYCNDLPRAVKQAVGDGYKSVEDSIQMVILEKFELVGAAVEWHDKIKDLDRRMVPAEKAAIMRYPQPWAHDQFKPLKGVTIFCWAPPLAKRKFLQMYAGICVVGNAKFDVEEYEI